MSATGMRRDASSQDLLLNGLLTAVRRDAHVLEAMNYGSPAVAEFEEFTGVFEHLWKKQLMPLFGDDLLVIAAGEAYPHFIDHDDLETGDVLIAFAHRDHGQEIYIDKAKRIAGTPLSHLLTAPDVSRSIWQHGEATQTLGPELRAYGPTYDREHALIAPYLVRALPSRPSADFVELLNHWKQNAAKSPLYYSTPFIATNPPSEMLQFRDAYYAAVLAIYHPVERSVSRRKKEAQALEWLELLHVWFQMAWGLPALSRVRQQKEAQQRERIILEAAQERHKQLRDIADSVSHNLETYTRDIRSEAHRLISALFPSIERSLDTDDIHEIFHDGGRLHITDGFELTGIHDAYQQLGDEPPDENLIRALTHYGVLRVLNHKFEQSRPSAYADLSNLVISELTRLQSPRLKRLLTALKDGDKKAFTLLKELTYSPGIRGRQVSWYSLATRLILGTASDQFYVTLKYNNQTFDLSAENFVERAFESVETYKQGEHPLCLQPAFPSLTQTHRRWFAPVVELVGHYLQKSKPEYTVHVPHVTISQTDRKAPTRIECELEGTEKQVKEIIGLLRDAEQKGVDGGHNMTRCWLRIPECCTKEFLNDRELVISIERQ